jgi:hypothetical protein
MNVMIGPVAAPTLVANSIKDTKAQPPAPPTSAPPSKLKI